MNKRIKIPALKVLTVQWEKTVNKSITRADTESDREGLERKMKEGCGLVGYKKKSH